jgi:hypothetical protein
MSLSNRGAGLVQRKRGAVTDDLPPERDDFDDDDNLADKYSKDAKLSLMEEVLLLGLKDEEVRAGSVVNLARNDRDPHPNFFLVLSAA